MKINAIGTTAVLSLETQDEINFMASVFGSISIGVDVRFNLDSENTNDVWRCLSGLAEDSRPRLIMEFNSEE